MKKVNNVKFKKIAAMAILAILSHKSCSASPFNRVCNTTFAGKCKSPEAALACLETNKIVVAELKESADEAPFSLVIKKGDGWLSKNKIEITGKSGTSQSYDTSDPNCLKQLEGQLIILDNDEMLNIGNPETLQAPTSQSSSQMNMAPAPIMTNTQAPHVQTAPLTNPSSNDGYQTPRSSMPAAPSTPVKAPSPLNYSDQVAPPMPAQQQTYVQAPMPAPMPAPQPMAAPLPQPNFNDMSAPMPAPRRHHNHHVQLDDSNQDSFE